MTSIPSQQAATPTAPASQHARVRFDLFHPDDIRPDIRTYLEGWYEKSKARQEAKGKRFDLSFADFVVLWGKRRIASLEQWMDDGSLSFRQRRNTPERPNPNGYILSPISFAASRSPVMDITNSQICTRAKGLIDCRMKKGDRHSAESKAKISAGARGIPKSDAHKAKISAGCLGKKRGPMSDAEKAKRSAGVKATLAAKRLAQNAAHGLPPTGNAP